MNVFLSEIIAAAIAAAAAIGVALIAHRRSRRAILRDDKKTQVLLQNEQVKIVTDAYDGILHELREEISRLLEARRKERARWEERETELTARVDELRETVTILQSRLQSVETDLDAVEKRADRQTGKGSA